MDAILNPALILFLSGIVIGLSFKVTLPNSISKYLGYYLLLALGLKGGLSLQENGFISEVVSVLLLGVIFALLIPIISYLYLKNILNNDDAAALSRARRARRKAKGGCREAKDCGSRRGRN